MATTAVYGASVLTRIWRTLVLTAGVIVIVLGYRFALLPITLYTA